ncbi:hypothetical protein B296_00025836 [Ensete ventricosum]|uniref:Uncharacterized protein n=1 Tax=Ensete ventricosum TaxID=4639 RepID=A0A426YA39_ENSVE|nr:hypothetical protein B296_00025836 [Ensete ventricosum]
MKYPWNDTIPLLPLQEFISLTSIQGKLRASTLCFIFYVDSLYAPRVFHQVPPKLPRPLICIKFMVTFALTILWVSPPLSLISISVLSVSLFGVALGRFPT